MKIFFTGQVKRMVKIAYNEGFLQGVKYQKGRTPKKIEVKDES